MSNWQNAVKIARAHTGRSAVIAFNGGYHGRTMMTLGLTGKVVPYKAGFGPFPAEIFHAPFPIDVHGITPDQSLTALENRFKFDVEPSRVAAIIIEPVQGEGGFYVAPFDFLQQLRALCDEHGILLVAAVGSVFFGWDSHSRAFVITWAISVSIGPMRYIPIWIHSVH